jgi:DNA-binding CsgD family transcriptional regulator
MKSPLIHQGNDALRPRPRPHLLRRMVALMEARGFLPRPTKPIHAEIASDIPREPSPPTPQELEALRWTMEGMTAPEIGTQLGLPEQVVASRLRSAMQKLECKTKYETVLKAIKLRLIEGPR